MKVTRQDKIEDFLANLGSDIDVIEYIDADEVNCYEDVVNAIEDAGGFEIDVIYYSEAMKYLTENDTSLSESIELAVEQGYDLKNITSELLASLHASANSRSKFEADHYSEINEFFDNLETDEDEEV
jgi:hypothetical protein